MHALNQQGVYEKHSSRTVQSRAEILAEKKRFEGDLTPRQYMDSSEKTYKAEYEQELVIFGQQLKRSHESPLHDLPIDNTQLRTGAKYSDRLRKV